MRTQRQMFGRDQATIAEDGRALVGMQRAMRRAASCCP
jgi:hypothetical protein